MRAFLKLFDAWRVGVRLGFVLRPHRLALSGVVLLQLCVVALSVLQPWPMKVAFDRVLAPLDLESRGGGELLLLCAGALLVIVVLRVLVEYNANLTVAKVGHRVTRALRLVLFERLLQLPPAYHGKQRSGDLLMRLMGDAPMVKTMLVDASTALFARSLHAIAVLAVMFTVDAQLTLILLGLVPGLAWVVRVLSRRLSVAIRKQRKKEGALADFMGEAVGAVTLVQSMGQEAEVTHRFARDNRRSARAELKAARAAARLSASVESLLTVGVALTLGLGGMRVLDGVLSPGELLVFMSYVRGLLKPARSAAKQQARVAKGVACADRLLDVLDQRSPVRERQGSRVVPAQPAVLALENVRYTYPDGRVALDSFDARFDRGVLTALVGASGSGKSTLVALALRLMDPTKGRVTLDGVPLHEYELDGLRSSVAASLQETVLFGTSVRENLTLAKPDATDEALWEAIDAAGALQVVEELPDGIDTALGSQGAGLSGGQRRRLCLARAFLRESPILLADEPFAGLDAAAARHVFASLKARSLESIVIVVTHDPVHLAEFGTVIQVEASADPDQDLEDAPTDQDSSPYLSQDSDESPLGGGGPAPCTS
ncbi:MAG: ABC transporter ATP-binding protein [bacterium]